MHGAKWLGASSFSVLQDLAVLQQGTLRRTKRKTCHFSETGIQITKDIGMQGFVDMEKFRNADGSSLTADTRQDIQKVMQTDVAVFRK